MDEILPRLYLGGYRALRDDIPRLRTHGITFILNVASEVHYSKRLLAYLDEHKIQHVHIPMKDEDAYPLGDALPDVLARMKQAYEDGQCIYVHCHRGISRSAAVVIAFVAQRRTWSVKEAHAFVAKKRPSIVPRESFLKAVNDVV